MPLYITFNRFIMSGDTLVIEITQKRECDSDDSNVFIAYVFYDYKTELYGIRFGKVDLTNFYETEAENVKDCIVTSNSFHTSDTNVLSEFIFEFIKPDSVFEICLANYSDLPKNTDNINFEILLRNYQDDNEIVSYLNSSTKKFNPKQIMDRLMNIITNVYNEY